ncbi:MAG: ATP-binding cassette domain-containing protein [Streptosporangiales bacterium]|nr:ATP-binding cassette domain-containing protein [Streptosporangiales bacterium]
MLQTDRISRSFGGVFAVRDVSLSIAEGELRGIIGPNGAGKSTLFNLITGHLRPDHGGLTYRGRRIDRASPHHRASLGISIVFQGARLFRGMTVLENVMVGAHTWTRHGFWSGALRLPRYWREEHRIRDRAKAAVDRVGLAPWAGRYAESLPLGHQRRLQIARALCAQPKLLLLDEPASGLRAEERQQVARVVRQLHREGLTMMLVEHDVGFVTGLADRVTVLDLGEVIADGTPEEIREDERVIAAYLGEGAADA